MLLAAAAYVALGLGTAALSRSATTHTGVVAWRLVAWLGSAATGIGQLLWERFRRRSRPVTAALHAALAVALGALALALAALAHRASAGLAQGSNYLAFLVWPLVTGIPAFLAALVVSLVLARLRSATGDS